MPKSEIARIHLCTSSPTISMVASILMNELMLTKEQMLSLGGFNEIPHA